MLVIMEDGDIKGLFESSFNFETTGSRDVLQVDTTKGGSNKGDGFDDFFRILGS